MSYSTNVSAPIRTGMDLAVTTEWRAVHRVIAGTAVPGGGRRRGRDTRVADQDLVGAEGVPKGHPLGPGQVILGSALVGINLPTETDPNRLHAA